MGRKDNNKLRRSKQHIRREAYAYIPLAMGGGKWLAYRFDDVSSGAYPVASSDDFRRGFSTATEYWNSFKF